MVKDYWHAWNGDFTDTVNAENTAKDSEAVRIPLEETVAADRPAEAPENPPEPPAPELPEKPESPVPLVELERAYDLDVLNTDSNYPLERIVEGLSNFAGQLVEKRNKVRNCCLLFYGASGTGKTEFGKYLANRIGFQFLVRRGSDLLGEYVGQTEHAIKKLFEEAERDHAVVMIDEADTFLRNRSLSQREYELSMTNELLCRMEEFNGIFICSTNLLKFFDPASMRRFVFKIEFKPLNADGCRKLCRKMMSEVCELPDDLSRIAGLKGLTPGNFRTVRDRLLILNETKISFEELLKELKLELALNKLENVLANPKAAGKAKKV